VAFACPAEKSFTEVTRLSATAIGYLILVLFSANSQEEPMQLYSTSARIFSNRLSELQLFKPCSQNYCTKKW